MSPQSLHELVKDRYEIEDLFQLLLDNGLIDIDSFIDNHMNEILTLKSNGELDA